jgi:DNA-binding transcriptional LysR family regulator
MSTAVAAARRPQQAQIKPPRRCARPAGRIDLHPRRLRCFVAVAEELHFSRAADRLFLPQPWLSRTIRQLEREVGTPLFVRNTRWVRLTPAGERLVPVAREVLEALDAVRRTASAQRAALRVPHVPGHDTVMLALDRLAEMRPEIVVDELAIDDGDQLAAIDDGRIDVAVCRLPSQPREGVCAELLRLDPALVAVRCGLTSQPEVVDLRRTRVALAAVRDDQIEDQLARELATVIGRALPRVRVAAGSGTETRAFERAGENAFVTFESALFMDGRYVRVATAPVQPLVKWWLVWRRENISPARQAFIDAARAVARERLWTTATACGGKPLIIGGETWTPTA